MAPTIRALLFISALCITPAFAAVMDIETWPDDGDTEGWIGLVSMGVSHNDTTDALGFSGINTDFLVGYIAAVAGSSGGAFVGDLTAAGVDAFEFDLLIDPGSDLDRMSLQILTYHSPYERWRYPLTGIVDGAYHHYSVPLSGAEGWTHELGSESFAFMLANVDSVRLRMYDGDDPQAGISGQLDNFSVAAPEPGTLALSALGLLALGLKFRRRAEREPVT